MVLVAVTGTGTGTCRDTFSIQDSKCNQSKVQQHHRRHIRTITQRIHHPSIATHTTQGAHFDCILTQVVLNPFISAIMSKEGKYPVLPHKPDPTLLESFRYINSMPGKNVRGKMIDCFQLWMKVDSSEILDSIKVSLILRISWIWWLMCASYLTFILCRL
jgi:hypothetical protein